MTKTKPDESLKDPLLARIENALSVSGTSPTAFGYQVAGDPALVHRMREGRQIKKPALREKIAGAVTDMLRAAASAAMD